MSCPTPHKHSYSSKDEARKTGNKRSNKLKPYKCPGCAQWHLTSTGRNVHADDSNRKRNYLRYFEQFKKYLKT